MITEKDIGRRVLVNWIAPSGSSYRNEKGRIKNIFSEKLIVVEFLNGYERMVPEYAITFTDDKFQPEYFTGLPQDVERAKQYLGKVMEFCDCGEKWHRKGEFVKFSPQKPVRFGEYIVVPPKNNTFFWEFMRTCPETFQEQKQYIEFPAGKLPAPERVKPEIGTKYYVIAHTSIRGYGRYRWVNDVLDEECFQNGIWLKESDIQQVVEWWRKTFGVEAVE